MPLRVRVFFAFFLWGPVMATLACKQTPTAEDAHRLLSGKYRLVVRHDCEQWGVDSDTLVLHADGRMEQHLKLRNGKSYDSVQAHWEYIPDHSVSLDRRLVISDPQNAGMAQLQVLIVEFSDPPVIVLNPDEDCFYERYSSAD
jgi:hypothetical protein